MKQLTLRMPAPYPAQRAVLEDVSQSVLVECAPCTRVVQSMMAWLLARALEGQTRRHYVALCQNPGAMRDRVAAWLDTLDQPVHAVRGQRIDLPLNDLFFWQCDQLDKIPYDRVEDLVIDGAHMMRDPSVWIAENVRGDVRMCGQVAPVGHWFYKACRQAEDVGSGGKTAYHRVTVQHALEAGIVSDEQIIAIRRGLPPAAFRQRYEMGLPETVTTEDVPFRVFARTRLKIRDKAGTLVGFELNGRQKSYAAIKRYWRKRGRRFFLVLKYRRGGITTHEQGESYEGASTRPNYQAVTLAHTRQATSQIFRIAQLMHREDPNAPSIKGVGNASRLEFPDLNSQFFIGTAKSSGFGRGDTLQRVHGSEVSKWFEGPKSIEHARDLIAGLTEAASHGEVVLETTANGNEWFAQAYRESKERDNGWTPIFMPWFSDRDNRLENYNAEEVQDTLTEKERYLLTTHKLDLGHIAWRRSKIAITGPLFGQEYPEDDESCFLTAGLIYFDVSRILDLLEVTPDVPVKKIGTLGFYVEYEEPIAGELYVAGSDTSEGVVNARGEHGDFNGVGVLHKRTGRMVAEFHGLFTPSEHAEMGVILCKRYNDALWGIERNNHGHAVIQRVRQLGYDAAQRTLYYDEGDKKPGWNTDTVSRPVMLSDLREALGDLPDECVKSRLLLRECLTFRRQPTGKFEASGGDHDDAVMKWAIAWQMRKVRTAGSATMI